MASVCPSPLDCSETYGRLTIDDWSLHTGAWCAFDLSTLTDSPAVRGENVLVETLNGRVARSGRPDEAEVDLPVMFSGAVDRTGAPYDVPAGGLLANIVAFVGRFIRPILDDTAALTAVLALPSPTTPETTVDYTFDVQPIRLEKELLPGGYARGVLTVRIPIPDPALRGDTS